MDHHNVVHGYATPTARTLPRQWVGRIRRNRPNFNLTSGSSSTVRPYVVDWPGSASDTFGVSYGGGIVGVTERHGILSGAVGTYQARWDAFLASIADGNNSAGMFAVPAVLPSGYTANPEMQWRSHSYARNRIWTASGYTTYLWCPHPTYYGSSVSSALQTVQWPGVDPPAPFQTFRGTYEVGNLAGLGIGFRKVQIRVSVIPEGLNTPTSVSGNVGITLTHNADGSTFTVDGSGDRQNGNTTDYAGTVAGWTDEGAGNFWTSWLDCGEVMPSTEGTNTYFFAEVDMQSVTTGPLSFANYIQGVQMRLSPRVDVPYRITHVGEGDLIAPGGIPT